MSLTLPEKSALLEQRLRQLGRVLIAYSGGVDSAYLAWAAHQTLGDGMLAIIADSPSLSRWQLRDAVAFAQEQHIPLEIISTSELDNPAYARNDAQRCFFCKDELFTVMERECARRDFDAIAYGVNADDQGEFRPGQRAATQHHVAAPLLDAGMTKQEIRELARDAGRASGTSPPPPAFPLVSSMAARSRPMPFASSKQAKTHYARLASASFASVTTAIWRESNSPPMKCRVRSMPPCCARWAAASATLVSCMSPLTWMATARAR